MRAPPFRHRLVSLRPLAALSLLFLASSLRAEDAAAAAKQPPPADLGTLMFQNVCSQCHGPKGEGNPQIKSPSIAHLPSWYVIQQINNFREDRRGTDPADPQGLLMAAISKALQPNQVHALAKHVEKMPMVMPTPVYTEAGADVENGMILFQERCMECHRYNASGEMAFGSPPLTGRQDWYLADQIKKFKTGVRGTSKADQNGAKMVLSSQYIGDEQTLKDVMAYIMTLNAAAMEEQQQQQAEQSATTAAESAAAEKVADTDKKTEQ